MRLFAMLLVLVGSSVAGSSVAGAQQASEAVHLPPPPTARIASGDSTARTARAGQYLARGDAAFAAGMRDTARVMWEDALYEDPRVTDASVKLATLLVETGQGYWAKRVIERALHFDPDNPKLLHFSAHRTDSADAGH